ncbi:Nucleolar complex protein 3 [Entophlyctis luteolus]|nr:Nucleolar complex protein 3 [Entophlyctis luteolus]
MRKRSKVFARVKNRKSYVSTPLQLAAAAAAAAANNNDDNDSIDLSDMDADDLLADYGRFLNDLNPSSFDRPEIKKTRDIKTRVITSDDEEDDEQNELVDDESAESSSEHSNSDEEQDYELAPRSKTTWTEPDTPNRLPAFGTDGNVILPETKKKILLPGEALALAKEMQKKSKDAAATSSKSLGASAQSEIVERKRKPDSGSKAVAGVGELLMQTLRRKDLTARERIQTRWDTQEALAELSTELIQSPEEKLANLKQMHFITNTPDSVVQKLGLLSQLAVFRDIVPGYRIRPLTEAEKSVKVTKEVKKLRNFEEGLLGHYQSYLQQLEVCLRRNCNPSGDSSVAVVAMQCMSELLTTLTHFNFRVNLLSAIVSKMGVKSPAEVGAIACNAICKLFDEDVSGEPCLEAVKLISRMIKNKDYKVSESVLKTFLHLRLKDEMPAPSNSAAGEEQAKKKKMEDSRKRKKDGSQPHVSKKMRKVEKKDSEITNELKEAEATYSHEERQKNHSETLKFVFLTYFRILKNAESSPLVPAVLEGLSHFGHLISVDYFADILALLKKIAISQYNSYAEGTNAASAKTSMHCIVAALLLLSGQGSAINVDLKDFNMSLYCQMSRLPLSVNSSDAKVVDGAEVTRVGVESDSVVKRMSDIHSRSEIELVLMGLDLLFCRKKQIQVDRCASFIKRLAIMCVHLKPNAVLACLSLQRALFVKHSRLQQLLDPEERLGTGVYKPYLDDAELCNPFASNLWELCFMMNHYHPVVRTMAKHVSRTSTGTSNDITGTKSLPPELTLTPPQFLKKFNSTPEYPTPTFVFVPAVTEPSNVTAAVNRRRSVVHVKRLSEGPAVIDESDFLLDAETQERTTVERDERALRDQKVVSDVIGTGDRELDGLVAREKRLRRLVEVSKELQVDLLPEDDELDGEEDDEGDDEEGSAENEGSDDSEGSTSCLPSFLQRSNSRKQLNGVQRAEKFISSLKGR